MIEKQVIIDVKEYEELKEWAEVGHSATEAVKKVLESGNPNEECRTITLYKREGGKDSLTKVCICTTDEALKDMTDAYQNTVKSLNEKINEWKDGFFEALKERDNTEKSLNEMFLNKIEEYNSLPLWKKIFKKIEF